MSLRVYNSQTQRKEDFVPLQAPQVKMYCCGPTVYDFLHVGNFRGVIFYNFVRNWLEASGYKVTSVYNYTDIDDKIINRAVQDKVPSTQIAETYIREFEKDFNSLGLRKHNHNPKVTEHLQPIVDLIQRLIENGKAYVVDGEVLYSVRSFADYGKLSHRNIDDLMTGTRIQPGERKKDPLDFALWKPSQTEPYWDSPWGKGRPGWHIECSAMARHILGDEIDIHGGGMDLIFPHHENEIAQSEGCSGKRFVKYWIHNNMINFSGAKMSKSLGNIRTGRSFIEEFNPEIFKYLILSVHYRSVSDFGEQAIENTITGLSRIYSCLALADSLSSDTSNVLDIEKHPHFGKLWSAVGEAFNDDFNTAEGMARVFELVREFNAKFKRGMKLKPQDLEFIQGTRQFIRKFGELMSLFQMPAGEFLRSLDDMLLKKMNIERSAVDAIVFDRIEARKNKDYKKSDELRDQLNAMKISVSDTPEGSYWEVTK